MKRTPLTPKERENRLTALIRAGLFTPEHLAHSMAFYRDGDSKKHTKNMNAPGSFRDPRVFNFINYITAEEFVGTIKEMAHKAIPDDPKNFSGTKLVSGETSHSKGWMLLGESK